jgi:pyruvate dehydrogenase (quinone)
VEDPANVKPALIEAFENDGPALVDIVVNRMELAMPPTIKVEQAIGFNLWALKAVLSGRGRELVDLAETNLLR